MFPSSKRRTAIEALTVFGGQAANGAALFLGIKALTSFLTTDDFGRFALGLTASVIAVQLLFGPLSSATLRVAADARGLDQYRAAFGATIRMLGRMEAWAGAIACLGCIGVRYSRPADLPLFVAASIAALLIGVSQTLESALSAQRRRLSVALSAGGGQMLRMGCAVLIASAHGATGAMIGYAIGSLLHSLLVLVYITVAVRPTFRESIRWEEETWIYIRPFLIWGVPSAVYFSIDRWAIEWYANTKQVAFYAAAQQLTQQPVSFAFAVGSLFAAPHLFATASAEGGRRRVHRLLWLSTLVIVVITLFCATILSIWSKPILALFAQSSYTEGHDLLARVFLSTVLFQLGQWWALSHLGAKQPSRLILPKVAQAILGSIFVVCEAKARGAIGATNALVITNLVYAGWIFWDAQKQVHRATVLPHAHQRT